MAEGPGGRLPACWPVIRTWDGCTIQFWLLDTRVNGEGTRGWGLERRAEWGGRGGGAVRGHTLPPGCFLFGCVHASWFCLHGSLHRQEGWCHAQGYVGVGQRPRRGGRRPVTVNGQASESLKVSMMHTHAAAASCHQALLASRARTCFGTLKLHNSVPRRHQCITCLFCSARAHVRLPVVQLIHNKQRVVLPRYSRVSLA